MKRLIPLALILALGLTASADEPKYTINASPGVPAEGKSIKVTDRLKTVVTTTVTDEDGKKLKDEKIAQTWHELGTEKTIKDGKADKDGKTKRLEFHRTYTKAQEGFGEKVETRPYQGRTIIFKLVEGKYRAKAKGKPELDRKVLEELVVGYNKEQTSLDEKLLMPGKAVKLGETWKVDGKAVAKYLSMLKPDPQKCKGEGKLVKVYKKDGKQFGSLAFTLEATGEIKGNPVKGTCDLALDLVLDGSSPASKMVVKLTTTQVAKVVEDGKPCHFELKFTMTNEMQTEEASE